MTTTDDFHERLDFDVEYVVMQGDEWCAGSSSIADAEHYAVVYGQDGPIQRQTAVTITFDGFLDHEAIRAALTPIQQGADQ